VGDPDIPSTIHQREDTRPVPNPPRHRSLRLPDYDYSQDGAYFVTVCTIDRVCLFGAITAGVFRPNEAGTEMERVWNSLSERFSHVKMDAFVVMPNHVHGILVFDGSQSGNASLSRVIGAYKSLSTLAYGRGAREGEWLPFNDRLWQASYYEHVIRSDESLNRIRSYIADNPSQWDHDHENLSRQQ
jgi:putative transposase